MKWEDVNKCITNNMIDVKTNMITGRGNRQFNMLGLRRQCRTIDLAVQGFTHKQIAHKCGIARRTVQLHLETAYKKLGVLNKSMLIAAVVTWGWVTCDECGSEPDTD